MNEPLKIFVGWDSREPAAYAVCAHSIITRANTSVSIAPLNQHALRESRLYTRARGATESTEFSITRFLVPALCNFKGYALFMDCDMLVQSDITEIWAYACAFPGKAVYVCQHDYVPKSAAKFLGNQQTVYPRKNWSSVMLFDCERCTALTPDYVNTATGLDLHRFNWLKDDQIGSLPLEWNHLVGEYESNPAAKNLHFTEGGVWHGSDYNTGIEAEMWKREFVEMSGAEVLTAVAEKAVA